MKIVYSKTFLKQFDKLPKKKQQKVADAIDLFGIDRFAPSLRLHVLTGEWKNHFSISAGGDLRLHFLDKGSEIYFFVAVGTHSQLY
jgi:mRNA-degrading endonuclease YafQ of YafQ-DinJ toxin-antitoxin module